ncbi:MAG: hypothetical protein PHY15_05250 [Eubacteriales bacterium]|nr:hypothetical protein [Eubacteriales bacterium]
MSDIISMVTVSYGKNKNHLKFQGFIPLYDPNRLYEFDFIGTEVELNTHMEEATKKQLRKQLCDDFGYAPFDIIEVQRVFGNGKDYEVD